jgi:hypothetical protein
MSSNVIQQLFITTYRVFLLCVIYLYQKINISLICDKTVITQNLAFLSYWYRKKRLQMHFLTGIVS